MKESLKIGVAGIGQPSFKGDKEKELKKSIQSLRDLQNEMDFSLIPYQEVIEDVKKADMVRKMMEDKGVSFLLIQSTSFAPGTLVDVLSKGEYHLGLWALPEGREEGHLPFNSLCGSNMNASILKRVKPSSFFKWFYGSPEGDLFLPRFTITLGAMRAVKALQELSIGLIIGPAPGFKNLEFNREAIAERFGTEITVIPDIQEIIERANRQPEKRVREESLSIREEAQEVSVHKDFVEKTARYVLSLYDISCEYGLNAFAVRCWPDTNREYGLFPCSALGRLNDLGIPASCEGDIYGVMGMALLRAITGRRNLLLDLVHVNLEKEEAFFWHCGHGCKELALHGSYCEDYHFNNQEYGMVRDMRIRPMEATILNLSQNGEMLYSFGGDFVEGGGFHGTGGLCTSLRDVYGPLSIKDLMATIYYHGLSHHYAVGPGDSMREIKEMKSWLGLHETRSIPYRPYL